MYKGLARLLGMDVKDAGPTTADLFDTLEACYGDHDFFYVHFKKTDAAGEDGNDDAKVTAIEELDAFIPRIEALNPDVLVVTSDHSTPCPLKGHSWHPNPFMIVAASAMPDDVADLSERSFSRGFLGRFPATPSHAANAGARRQAEKIRSLMAAAEMNRGPNIGRRFPVAQNPVFLYYK